jgi:hypothetical protein
MMENTLEVIKEQAKDEELYELGEWMGRKQAFGLIASKTAAADVECLKRIRDAKLYRAKGVDWPEFCKQYAGVDRSYADRLIRQFETLGPDYFHLSRIVRISPQDYKHIAPAITDDGLEFGDEKIVISPENSDKLVEAVTALRTAIPPKPAVAAVAAARKRLEAGIAAMNQALQSGLTEAEREDLAQAVKAGLTDLTLISASLGGY